MNSPVIEINHLSYTYLQGTPLATPALRDITLAVSRSEIVAIAGPAGAGKTTLLQCCNGLLRPPSPGLVRVLGTDTATEVGALRLKVGLLIQRSHAQLIERFVGDDVAYGPRQQGLSHDEVRECVRWAMTAVGLDFERFKDRLTFNLSGGEMRKVALAGILAMKPEILLLDEPFAGLDPESRQKVFALIKTLKKQAVTVVMATTNVEDLPGLAERIFVLDGGMLAGELKAADLAKAGEFLRAHGLDLPELGLIVETLNREGHHIQADCLEPESLAEEICKISPTYAT